MAGVETMRGVVDAGALGQVLMHEHVFVLTADVQANYPGEFDADARIADAVAKLEELHRQGVSTILDPTVVGLGRNIPLLAQVAEQVEINIVVATGIYTYTDAPYFFRHRGPAVGVEPDPMIELFVADIREGIAGTGVKAGMLKCAIDRPGLTPDVERVFRAVGAAHRQTGTPITVHTHPETRTGLDVHRVLSDAGVPATRVVLGHSGDTSDADHLSELASLGYTLGMDRFGLELDHSFEDRIAIVVEMCRRGFAESMVLSQDAACYIDWLEPAAREFLPHWHYLHVIDDVVPALLERGVTEDQVEAMLVRTPRRVLEPAG